MNLREIQVRKGEPVKAAWERLLKWLPSLKVEPDDGITIRETPHGTIVRVADSKMFRHPFRVSVGSKSVKIASGTINDEVPVMATAKEGKRRIDNRDKDGKRETDKAPPELPLDLAKASDDGRIYVSLKYQTPPTEKGAEARPPEIVQTADAKGPVDGFGYYPLAFLWLSTDRKSVDEVFQIVHHNLRCTYQERRPSAEDLKKDPETKPIGRYVFYPT
jgi:hypothetical protein